MRFWREEDGKLRASLAILRQNYEHFRHVENERLWFTNIYAITVGAVLAFVSRQTELFTYSMMFLSGLSILGFLMSVRLRSDLQHHQRVISAIARELKIEDVATLGAQKGPTIHFKLRDIFPVFYLFMLGFFALILVMHYIT